MNEKALLIVGSPKGAKSNSFSIGRYLLDRLGDANWTVDNEFVYRAIKDQEKLEDVLQKIDNSNLIILAFPLYVDSMPSQMIKFLEKVFEHGLPTMASERKLIAICQSGFPESHHNDYALRICSIFAKDAGFHWAGGLSVGGGAAIASRDLSEAGGMMRNLRGALDATANAMIAGKDVPEEAKKLAAKGFAPPWMYNWIVNRNWKKEERNNGVDLRAMPHSSK